TLRDVLRDPDVRQLDQRISTRCELKPLTAHETSAYVAHRLTIAGGPAVSFAPNALELVHQYTGGTPRLINLVCDRALHGGYSARTTSIPPDMVETAANTLELQLPRTPLVSRLQREAVRLTVAAAVLALAIVGTIGALLWRSSGNADANRATSAAAALAPSP